MASKNIARYGVSLKRLFRRNIEDVELVRDENLQILRLDMGGSVVHTDGVYYDLYNKKGDLVLCDGEEIVLVAVDNRGDKNIYAVANYDGEQIRTYVFTKEEFETVVFKDN